MLAKKLEAFEREQMTHQTTMVDGVPVQFREVWAHNLEQEMSSIRKIIHKFPCIAMVSVAVVL